MVRLRHLRFIPNLLSLLNLTFGFLSILCAISGDYRKAALLIVGAVVVDALDGFIARKLGADTRFGLELDSLCDFLSFCVSPSVLFYTFYGGNYWFLFVLLPICGALRLARFNVTSQKDYFIGLPSPVGGGFLASITLIKNLSGFYAVPLLVLVSFLMVSGIRYINFKSIFRGVYSKTFLIVVSTILLSFFNIQLVVVPFLIYVVLCFRLGAASK